MAKVKITLVKSLIGSKDRFRRTAKSLGLGKLNSSVIHEKSNDIIGKINQLADLVATEEVK